ncbi:MAG: hypothetical protein ACE5KM_04460 [Planctomycetaceae bacterium]
MPGTKYTECSFLIPICGDANLSDGDPHPVEYWEWLFDELFERFGGGTLAPGMWEGFYTDPDSGTRVSDESRKYIVAILESELPSLRGFLAECCREFDQKCVYLSVAGDVEFVEHPDLAGDDP